MALFVMTYTKVYSKPFDAADIEEAVRHMSDLGRRDHRCRGDRRGRTLRETGPGPDLPPR